MYVPNNIKVLSRQRTTRAKNVVCLRTLRVLIVVETLITVQGFRISQMQLACRVIISVQGDKILLSPQSLADNSCKCNLLFGEIQSKYVKFWENVSLNSEVLWISVELIIVQGSNKRMQGRFQFENKLPCIHNYQNPQSTS